MWEEFGFNLLGGGMGAGIVWLAATRFFPPKYPEKPAEAPAARLPEVGDCYLILDDLWRVRSRDVTGAGTGKGTQCIYSIYIEHVHSTTGVPPHGVKLRSHTPEWLAQWTLIGNMAKDRAKIEASLKEMAIKHGVSVEEVQIALDSTTGEVDMSSLPKTDKGLPEPPPHPRHLKTMTGHPGHDQESLAERFECTDRRMAEERGEDDK